MYHLGHVVVSDENSGTLYLRNSEVMSVNRNTCGSLELTRSANVCQDINASTTDDTLKDTHLGRFGVTDDNMLTLCMDEVFSKVFKR